MNFPKEFLLKCRKEPKELHLIPVEVKNRFNNLVLRTFFFHRLLKLNRHLFQNQILFQKNRKKPKFKFKGQFERSKERFLLEHYWNKMFNTIEKEFYYCIFQWHITGEGESIYITFPVPTASSKKRKWINFPPTNLR